MWNAVNLYHSISRENLYEIDPNALVPRGSVELSGSGMEHAAVAGGYSLPQFSQARCFSNAFVSDCVGMEVGVERNSHDVCPTRLARSRHPVPGWWDGSCLRALPLQQILTDTHASDAKSNPLHTLNRDIQPRAANRVSFSSPNFCGKQGSGTAMTPAPPRIAS